MVGSFPETWPAYSPSHKVCRKLTFWTDADSQKLADWLAFYAGSLDLNVWTSASVTSVRKDPVTNAWSVVVERGGDRKEQRILHPTHVVFAIGLMSGNMRMPVVPGQVSKSFLVPRILMINSIIRRILRARSSILLNIELRAKISVKRLWSLDQATQHTILQQIT
jgi:hypothetical protein